MKKNALENEGIFSIVSSGNSVSHHRPMTRASFRLELLIASSRKIGFFQIRNGAGRTIPRKSTRA